MEINVFLCETELSLVLPRGFGDPANDEEGSKIIYTDELLVDPIANLSAFCKKSEWNSILTESFTVEGQEKSFITLSDNQYLIIQLMNNTGYGADKKLVPTSLIALNLMISPHTEKSL